MFLFTLSTPEKSEGGTRLMPTVGCRLHLRLAWVKRFKQPEILRIQH